VLSDHGNEVAERFGLRFALPDYLREVYLSFPNDLAKVNGEPSWTLPMPARFVIDRSGVIRWRDVDPDYTTRSEPSETVKALQALKA
jgi:peroxiredoxin